MENCTSPALVSEMRSKSAHRGPSSGEKGEKKREEKKIMIAASHRFNLNGLALE